MNGSFNSHATCELPCCDKHLTIWAHDFRRISVHHSGEGSRSHPSVAGGECSCLFTPQQAGSRKGLEARQGSNPQSPTPCSPLLPVVCSHPFLSKHTYAVKTRVTLRQAELPRRGSDQPSYKEAESKVSRRNERHWVS